MSQKFLFVLWPTFDELMTLCTNILLPHFREKYLTDCRQTWYLALMYYSPDLIRFWCTMAYFWRSYDVFFRKNITNLYLAVSWEQFMTYHHQTLHLASIYYPPNLIWHLCTLAYFWRIFGIMELKHCYHCSKKSIWCIITKHYNFLWYISLHAWFEFGVLWPTFNELMNVRCQYIFTTLLGEVFDRLSPNFIFSFDVLLSRAD